MKKIDFETVYAVPPASRYDQPITRAVVRSRYSPRSRGMNVSNTSTPKTKIAKPAKFQPIASPTTRSGGAPDPSQSLQRRG